MSHVDEWVRSWPRIRWHESTSALSKLVAQNAELSFSPLSPGLEAEVIKITLDNEHFVLKVWNKQSKPDVQRQYKLLVSLNRLGICVSEPVAYGLTETADSVLLTRYHGSAVNKVNPTILKKIAGVFASIHRLSTNDLDDRVIATYDFAEYFFPGIDAYPTMKEELTRLIAASNMRKDRVIHGDFNLGNIVEENGQYTVIDWTNGQVGDARYDLAWACFLLRIYLSESKSLTFLHMYQEEMSIEKEELEVFEALSCLRWLLLDRMFDVPKHADTVKRVNKIVKENDYLNDWLLHQ